MANKKLKTEKFIQRAKQVHGNRYDYSLVEYENKNSVVKIIGPVRGVFEQIAHKHLSGMGDPRCCGIKKFK